MIEENSGYISCLYENIKDFKTDSSGWKLTCRQYKETKSMSKYEKNEVLNTAIPVLTENTCN